MEKIEVWFGGFRLRANGKLTVVGVLVTACWAMTYFQEAAAFLLKIGP